MASKKTPQKASGKGSLDRVGEKGTGGWTGKTVKTDPNPPLQSPKPVDHGESAVPK